MLVVDDRTVKMEKLEKLESTQRNPELDAFMKEERSKGVKIKSKKKLLAMMSGGFIFALLLGYFTLSYYHDKQDITENERMHKKQIAMQQKETSKTNAIELGEVKTKTENYLKEIKAKQEVVTQSVDNAEKEIKKITSTAENIKTSGKDKLQTILIENAPIIDDVTQFIQMQKDRFMQFISEQTEKSNGDKKH